MKKMTKWAVCALAAMTLVTGCSNSSNTAESSTEASESAAETSGTTSTVPESLAVEDMGEVTKLGEYKGVEIDRVSDEVTEENIDAQIQSILDANAEYVELDRPAVLGDTVNIDYVGMKDGVAFDGGTAQGHEMVLGQGGFIDGFETGLVGAKKGDELSLNLTFPEDYRNEELAGQDVVFDVTVNSVEEVKEAELNDAFVQRVSDFNTVEEFRADTKESLQVSKTALARNQMQMAALQIIIDNTEVSLNEDAVESEFTSQKEYYSQMTQMYYGMDLASYLTAVGTTEEEFDGELRAAAEETLKMELVMDAIIKAEGIVADEEGRQSLAEQGQTDLDTLISGYGEEYVDNLVCQYKVLDVIMDHAKIKESADAGETKAAK